jgi:hypothetical protein
MRACKRILANVALGGVLFSGFPGAIVRAAAQNAAAPLVARVEAPLALNELPDSPGTVASKSSENSPQQSGNTASPAQSQPSSSQAASPQSQPQNRPSGEKPVGTAAAEAPDASGIAASQPAGIAMAPAKQRRTRTLIIRMGAIIGAGVAVGSVVALTAATSSKPPGAH